MSREVMKIQLLRRKSYLQLLCIVINGFNSRFEIELVLRFQMSALAARNWVIFLHRKLSNLNVKFAYNFRTEHLIRRTKFE